MSITYKKLAVAVAGAGVLSLAACAGDSSEGGSSTELSIFAGNLPENSPQGTGVKAMIEHINEQDVGIEAAGFYDTSLGDATSMVQGLQQGTIDVGLSGNAYYSGLIPEIEVFELPFLFEDVEQARDVTAPGEVRDTLFEYFADQDLVGLSIWEGGLRQLSNNSRPIKTPDDLSGIKLRTLPSPIQQEAWSVMGALPQAIDSSELYTALQQGTVDGQENPLSEIVFRKMYEVQDYVSLTSHVYTPHTMAVSQSTWDSLTDEQKQVLRDAAEIGRDVNLEANDEAEADALQVLLDEGVTVEQDVDRAPFEELGTTVWPMYTDEYGSELLDLIRR